MPELTGEFHPDNGNEVVGYSGKFAGRTFGSAAKALLGCYSHFQRKLITWQFYPRIVYV
jgi:hypothetical protein